MNDLQIRPITLKDANAYVKEHHRHHKPTTGHKFSISVKRGDDLVGVAICGRPVARMADDGVTLEILRVCTDGSPNACSMLYGACRRAGAAMGYSKIITYTLPSEGGVSLRASGFRLLGDAGGGSWSRSSRPRGDHAPLEVKAKWSAT